MWTVPGMDMTEYRPAAPWNGASAADFPADPYPGRRMDCFFVLLGDRVHQVLPAPTTPSGWMTASGYDLDVVLEVLGEPRLARRLPVLAYGSNANPAKLAGLRIGPVVALRVSTTGLAAAWCTHPRWDGQIPATLVAAPGAAETHHVLLCTLGQMSHFDRIEGRAAGCYHLGVLRAGTVTTEDGQRMDDVLAYVGGRGRQPLAGPVGGPMRLSAVPQAEVAHWAARASGAFTSAAVVKCCV